MNTRMSLIQRAALVLLLLTLSTGAFGCGGGGSGGGAEVGGSAGGVEPSALTQWSPAGKTTWEDILARHEELGVPAEPGDVPEGATDEQTPPGGPHGVEGEASDAGLELKLRAGDEGEALVVDLPGFRALGQDISGGGPPDTMGAVGPDHVMTTLNVGVQIQDKLGNLLMGPVTLEAFFAPLVGANMFDPRVVYDQLHDRWLVTANRDARAATSGIGFAISDTDDPTGAWTFYSFDLDPTDINWADFVSIGFNSTWIALTTDALPIAPGPFAGEHMWVIDMASALAGGLLTVTQFTPGTLDTPGFTARRMKPCVTFDAAEPTLYLASSVYLSGGAEQLRLSQITGTGGAPVWSVLPGSLVAPGSGLFTPTIPYQTAGFGLFPGAPQSGGATLVDTGRALLSSETIFRNGHIWLTHTGGLPAVGAVTRTAVFWYEIDPATFPVLPIVQSGVCDGAGGGPPPGETIMQLSTDGTINVGAGNQPGQSFTVGINGTITGISFNHLAGYAGNLQIYSGAGNGGALLYNTPIAGAAGLTLYPVVPPVAVTPGVYTFYTGGGTGSIRQQSGNAYPGGIMYNGNSTVGNTDLQFQVDIAGGAPVADWYYYPSLAVNARNDMCLGFSRSSPSLFVDAVVTGRDFGDPLGTLDPLVVQKAGEGFYSQVFNGRNRWGDYSATCVDPSDDLTIWSIQEYAQAGNTYGTWWARHAIADPITGTSTLTYPTNTMGATANEPLNCAVPPAPTSVNAECTSNAGSACSIAFSMTAPSGSAFDVELRVDGVVLQTQTATGMLPGPSALVGVFNFPLALGGPYLVEVRADGGGGDLHLCQVNVTVVDTTAPTIGACPAPITLECTGAMGTVVNFTAPTATDVCDASVDVVCVPASGFAFPVGVTSVTCTATDDAGLTDACMFDVTVQDTVPPVVLASAQRSMLFLPRNGMIDVLLSQSATDLCTAIASKTVTVYSSQPNGGGSFSPDASLAGTALSVRAETLLGTADPAGRAYLIVVTATDTGFPVANTASACTWVIVPKTASVQDIIGARNIALSASAACPNPGPGPAPAATPDTILATVAIP